MTWISIADRLPEMQPGQFSETVLVKTGEFGIEPQALLARYWLSSASGAEPKWYIDPMRSIADQITHWMTAPEIWRTI
jgi:hypothetical protein